MPDVTLTPVGGDPWNGGAVDLHPSVAPPVRVTVPDPQPSAVEQNALSGDPTDYTPQAPLPGTAETLASLGSGHAHDDLDAYARSQMAGLSPMARAGAAAAYLPASVMTRGVDGTVDALTYPRDVMRGRVDPTSDEGIARNINLVGNAAGAGMPMAESGAAGIFGGRLSATADHAALARAESALAGGASRDAVWRDTGWFRGLDGEMRYEIPDQEAAIKQNVLPSQSDQPAGDLIHHPSMWASRLMTTSDALSHDALFSAYPELRDLPTVVGTQPEFGPAAADYSDAFYQPPTSGGGGLPEHIGLKDKGYSLEQTTDSLLHELQHAIQRREGFSRGSNPSNYSHDDWIKAGRPEDDHPTWAYGQYETIYGENEARTVERRRKLMPEDAKKYAPWQTSPADEWFLHLDRGSGAAPDAMFAGRNAATANNRVADLAERALKGGVDPEEVRQASGWFRGADGKMRTEISDAGATLRPGALDAIRTSARYLPDVLDHPDLYAAYPGLKNMIVTGEALPGTDPKTMAGTFYSNRGRPDTHAMLYLGPDDDLAEVRNTLLHETQHAVQGIEGFNAGASPDGLKAALPSTKALKDTKLMSALLQSGVAPEDAAAYYTERMGGRPHSAALDLAQRLSPDEVAKLPLGPKDAYHRNIGEVEARNVEARSTMTPAELAATAPWDSQSVPTAMQRPETGGVAWQFDSPGALDRHRAITDAVDGLVASGWTPSYGPQGSIRSRPPEIADFASPKSQAVIRDRLAFHGIVPPGTRNLSLYGAEESRASLPPMIGSGSLLSPTSTIPPEMFGRLLREGKAT